jgi:hypothetical protein
MIIAVRGRDTADARPDKSQLIHDTAIVELDPHRDTLP